MPRTKDLARIFKAYDVRGLVPDELDADVARRVARAFVEWSDAHAILVGRDCRLSSPDLFDAVAAGATGQGADVVDLGLASTDLLYFASGSLALPGVMITASHNPKDYNGLKLCLGGARPVGEDSGLGEIMALAERDPAPVAARGSIETRDLLDAYVDHVLSFVDVGAMRPLTVAVDTANGMGGLVAPAVLSRLPVTAHHLFAELDGTFPNHPADPIDPENQRDLKRTVGEVGADVGLAFDGDADRVFLIDERADDVSGSLLTALVARAMLRREPGGRIVYNLVCSRAVPEVIREEGGEPVRARVGHSFIKRVMADSRAVFGGEHSGHYYFRDNYFADSGLIAAAICLAEISAAGEPLSELLRPFRRYHASGEINSRVEDKAAAIEALASRFAEGRQDRLDGLTVEFEDWWFNARPSNTEPLLRLNVEARTPELLARRTAEAIGVVRGEGGPP